MSTRFSEQTKSEELGIALAVILSVSTSQYNWPFLFFYFRLLFTYIHIMFVWRARTKWVHSRVTQQIGAYARTNEVCSRS